MQLRRLVFPAPLGPMIALRAPRATEKLTSETAVTPPKRRATRETSRRGEDIRPETTPLRYRAKPAAPAPRAASTSRGGGRARGRNPRSRFRAEPIDANVRTRALLQSFRCRTRRSRPRLLLATRCTRGPRRRRLLRLLLDALRHHPDRPPTRRVADRVERLHRPHVLRLVVRVEEDDRRSLRGFLALGQPVVGPEALQRIAVRERLAVQVPDPRLVDLEHDLRQIWRWRLVQHLRRGLFGDAHADLLLHQRREHHEDDEQYQHHVDERRDVDVRARPLAGADCHRHGYFAPFSSSAASETPLSFALDAQSSTGRTLP